MSRPRILVVDDEPAMLRSVTRVLEEDHRVLASSSPPKALALAEACRPDVAVLDIRMPEMDGFELMEALKARDEDLQVILMTGSVYDVDEKLVRAIRGKAFYYITKPFDRGVLRALVHRCLELKSMRDAERRYLAHVEQELALARAFQETMLPAREAVVEGFEVLAAYRPSAELAGDLYDYAAAGRGRVALLVADVAGHGASAAMLTAVVKSAFHASGPDAYHPLAVTRRVAKGMAPFDESRFVTLLCARLSAGDGVMEYVSAGHGGGLIAAADGRASVLQSTGLLISSAFPDAGWDLATAPWAPASRILLHTDGLWEALHENEASGPERVRAIMQSCRGAGLLDAILSHVDSLAAEGASDDDVTLLTAGRATPGGGGAVQG